MRALALVLAAGTLLGRPPARPAGGAPSVAGVAASPDGSGASARAASARAASGAAPWWRADRAAVRWPAALPAVAGAVRWRVARPGVEVGELALGVSDAGLALAPPAGLGARLAAGVRDGVRPVRVVLLRVDPARVRLALAVAARPDGGVGPWTLDAAAPDAVLALNAGQFDDGGPWGWIVHAGRERQAPGAGALAGALVVDTAGRARVVGAAAVAARSAAVRAGDRSIALAVQSYPMLLDADAAGDGAVPALLRPPAGAPAALDLAHRDARLAVGTLRDGRLLVALTRFDLDGALPAALGAAAGRLPVGLTVPESAALMGALGASHALLLDGGLSAQLLVREAGGATHRWPGLRAVPLAIVGHAVDARR